MQLQALLLSIAFLLGTTRALDACVSPEGSDTNDCLSRESPCKTLAAGLLKLNQGDKLTLLKGTYTGEGNFQISFHGWSKVSGGEHRLFSLSGMHNITIFSEEHAVIDGANASYVFAFSSLDGNVIIVR